MTDPTRLLAAAAFLCMAVIVIGWWRAEVRADRAETARDTAMVDCANATALANQHWADLQRARAHLANLLPSEDEHWATVPRETPDSNAGHSASMRPTVPLPVLGDDTPTAVLPAAPRNITPEEIAEFCAAWEAANKQKRARY